MDRKSWVVLGVLLGGLFLALFGFLMLAYMAVKAGGEGTGGLGGGPAIGVIEIKGAIENTDEPLKQLRKLDQDESIKAILVRVDSPGGAVAPSQEIYSELRRMAAKRPVVCSLGNVAASGGFYIAVGCQKIVANPGTITGSIGVISQQPYLGAIAEELKFKLVVFKAGKLKDVGNPFREFTEEERAYFQGLMDGIHEQFISAVVEGRGLKDEEVRPIADGRIFTGKQAKELKLVDELGSFNDAIRLTASLAGIEGEPKLRYPPEKAPFGFQAFLEEGGASLVRGLARGLGAHAEPAVPEVALPATLAP